MNREEFLNATATGGLLQEDRNRLLSCFDENGELDESSFAELSLMMLQHQTSSRIQLLNKKIADAIHEFEFMGQWTNLSQVLRSLPESIANAACQDKTFGKEIAEWSKEIDKFLGLSKEERKLALEYVEEQEWRYFNRGLGSRE